MGTEERRSKILERLKKAKYPITGAQLAEDFEVSRQIIVGDISILRATGMDIYATPRGYFLPEEKRKGDTVIETMVIRHDAENMRQELEAIVDEGACVSDVIVEHPVYGEIRGDLMIASRYDIDVFLRKMEKNSAKPLLDVSAGIHLHTVEAPNQEVMKRIRMKLERLGFLAEGGTA